MLKKSIIHKLILLLLLGFLNDTDCSDKSNNPTEKEAEKFPYDPPSSVPLDPFVQNKLLAKSVNLSALEAPNEGDWGITLTEEYFQLIKDIGFNAVRLPVCWSSHMNESIPYKVEQKFLQRVEWAVNQALKRELAIIVNSHHFDGIYEGPDTYREKFLASWEIIADYFKKYPDQVFFEILNEPNGNLNAAKWNNLLKDVLLIIRETNPGRTVIIGPANWNAYDALPGLQLPEDDHNIIATYHYYLPFQFTHQGAEWVEGSNSWLGTKWINSYAERREIEKHMDSAAKWAQEHNRPLSMGEFGAYSKADINSRFLWTRHTARSAEARNISWAYWEFNSGFGVHDREKNEWNEYLVLALLEKKIE